MLTSFFHRFREPTSSLTHLLAALLSISGSIWLIFLTLDDIPKMVTMLVYGASATFLYFASTIYHLSQGSPSRLNWLVRFDRAGIFLIIAGTYTPIIYHFLDGYWRWGMLAAIWTIAIGGSLYVIFFFQRGKSRKLPMTIIYVIMGSIGLIAAPQYLFALPDGALLLMASGAVSYFVGAVVYSLDKPNFHKHFNAHDLWHIFVMSGGSFFFATILLFVAMD